MHRRLPYLVGLSLLASALAACVDRDDAATGQRPFTAVARFLPGEEVTVIQVTVSDRQPLRAADLLGPGGAVVAAESVDARQIAGYQPPFSRQSIAGELGAGGALPLGGFGNFAGSERLSSGQIRSTALIRLPDPQSYIKDWRSWEIRLRLGDPPRATVLTLPAPQPPASL
jgi:hypothetical protein